jgi:hypothetical protein
MRDHDTKGVPPAPADLRQVDGIDRANEPGNQAAARATEIATEAARRINAECRMGRQARVRIATTFHRIVVPRRAPGRKPKPSLTLAVQDYKAGLRGPQLFRKYISGFERMNRYKREVLARRLKDAIRTRIRRERQKRAGELSSVAASLSHKG